MNHHWSNDEIWDVDFIVWDLAIYENFLIKKDVQMMVEILYLKQAVLSLIPFYWYKETAVDWTDKWFLVKIQYVSMSNRLWLKRPKFV